jgi:hypothetical protein
MAGSSRLSGDGSGYLENVVVEVVDVGLAFRSTNFPSLE